VGGGGERDGRMGRDAEAESRMIATIAKQEWRLLKADRTLVAVVLLMALLVGYSLYNGSSWVAFQRQTLEATATEQAERLAKLKSNLTAIEEGRMEPKGFQDPRSAGAIGGTSAAPYLAMPPAPLATLAIGQSDLYPYYFKLNLRSKQAILANDEIENPTNLLAGRFDLAFVLVYLFPLLVLALGYNMISAEREQGTLSLALSQPITTSQLVVGKVLLRGGLLLGLVVVFTLAGAVVTGVDLSLPTVWMRLGLWIGLMTLYTGFWFGLAVLVNSFATSSATNALTLAGAWLGLVLVLPSVANLIATSVYPVPSRVEMVQAMRTAGKDAQTKGSMLLSKYMEDHPELMPAGDKPQADFASLTYAVQIEVDKQVQPILDRFDGQVDKQQDFVDGFRFLSPAILAQSAINDLAGTSLGRYKHFSRQVDGFFEQWKGYFLPKVFAKVKLKSSELGQFPDYSYTEESDGDIVGRVGVVLAGMALLTAGVLGLGFSRMRRASVAGN
jgi:ABC-2 type transport system permease protein